MREELLPGCNHNYLRKRATNLLKCLQRNFTWKHCCIVLHLAALYFVQCFVHVRFRCCFSSNPLLKEGLPTKHLKKRLSQKEATRCCYRVAVVFSCLSMKSSSILSDQGQGQSHRLGEQAAVNLLAADTGVLSLVHRSVLCDAYN